MADSNSHQPRCACGFWGSAQTLGLCSKCYKEHQKKNADADDSSGPGTSSCSVSANLVAESLQQAIHTSDAVAMETNAAVAMETNASEATATTSTENGSDKPEKEEDDAEPSTAETSEDKEGATSEEGDKAAKDQPVPGTKRERNDSESTEPDRPPQKNKKRCFKCNCKMELAIREIGRCRCDYIFCQLHRLPEQHDCIFNHKEKGRQEARDKMVSPKKHVGNSLKRIDSDS